jgi:hypothetical protein
VEGIGGSRKSLRANDGGRAAVRRVRAAYSGRKTIGRTFPRSNVSSSRDKDATTRRDCGLLRTAISTPRPRAFKKCIGPSTEKPSHRSGYAAVSDLTTETLTRYPNPARMRTSKSLDT